MSPAEENINYYHYSAKGWETIEAGVIGEASISMSVNGVPWLAFLCTPTRLEALAAGFLFNEGIIQTGEEIASIGLCCQGSNIDVWLHRSVEKPTQWRKTSGCTGGATRGDSPAPLPAVQSGWMISPEEISRCMEQLLQGQDLYRNVRGVHCSALSDGERILALAEDIGRHNTLDKIAGIMLMEKIDGSNRMVLTTGRVSSEMLQKSARLGAAIVVSRTSPSSLSIQLAREFGLTLIGYARRGSFNVYAHPERLDPARQASGV